MDMGNLKEAIEILDNQSISNREMTAQMIRVLLYVAANPAKTQKEICIETGINKGTISRVVQGLSTGSSKKGGLKLIKGVLNMQDYRSRQYYLTNKGLELKYIEREYNEKCRKTENFAKRYKTEKERKLYNRYNE